LESEQTPRPRRSRPRSRYAAFSGTKPPTRHR
jgi:hypothetical protein